MPHYNIILFLKEPKAGHSKTRLAEEIGTEKAVVAYRTLLQHNYQILKKLSLAPSMTSTVKIYSYLDSHSSLSFVDWLKEQCHQEIRQQKGMGLSEKLNYCFNDFTGEKTVIIGSDTANFKIEYLLKIFELLDYNDIVIGPSEDGGYWSIAMKETYQIFDKMTWSHKNVLKRQLSIIKDKKLTYTLTNTCFDLDDKKDYQRLLKMIK